MPGKPQGPKPSPKPSGKPPAGKPPAGGSKPPGRSRLKKLGWILLAVMVVFNPYTQAWIAGWLVVDDGTQQVDAVVGLRGDPEEQRLRTEEAADLLMKNLAPLLVVDASAKPFFGVGQADLVKSYLQQRGVPFDKMRVCENVADSTAEEAAALRRCFIEWGVKRAMVVTSEYHTRRTRFIFRNAMEGVGIQVFVRPVYVPQFWDAHWWRSRRWAKTFVSETLKIMWTGVEYIAGGARNAGASLPLPASSKSGPSASSPAAPK